MFVLGSATKNVAIIDYMAGNLKNISKALSHINANPVKVSSSGDLKKCDYILIPGMGSAVNALKVLHETGLFEEIVFEKKRGKGIIGICLGYQLFYNKIAEANNENGLGFFNGNVEHLSNLEGYSDKVPNIGWYRVFHANQDHTRFPGHANSFYFAHSYTPCLTDEVNNLAYTSLSGHKIISVSQKDNVIGCQFHPEKSGTKGLEFLEWLLNQILL